MFTYNQIFDQKQKILIITAHPDDSIVFFGGLIERLCRENKEVVVVLVTNGARGSRENDISEEELSKLRLGEEKRALSVLGVKIENIHCLNYADGDVESDQTLIGHVAKYIRMTKADIVCTHEPSLQYLATYDKSGFFVQHRDHRKVGEAVIDAVYPFSRDRSFFTEHYAQGLEPHSVFDILLTDENGSNFEIDITQDVEKKRDALKQHASQFNDETVEDILTSFSSNGRHMEKFTYIKLLW